MKRRSVIALIAAAALLTGCSSGEAAINGASGGSSVEGSAVLTGSAGSASSASSAGSAGSAGSVGSASPSSSASSAEHGTPGASGADISAPDSSAASADSGGSGGSAGSAGSAGSVSPVSSADSAASSPVMSTARLQLLRRSTPQVSRPRTTTPPPTSAELRAVTAAWSSRKGKYSRT